MGKKWLDLADVLILARFNNQICAFATGKFLEDDFVLLIATMVDPKYQNYGLSTFINSLIIKKAFWRKIKRGKFLGPLYFAFRTPNPILYASTAKKVRVIPSVNGIKPDSKEIGIFRKIVREFFPNLEYDQENLTVKGAYLPYPELVYQKDIIPWSRDERVNEFFEKNLKLTKREGNTMVVIGKV